MSKANNSWSAKRKVSAVVAGTLAGAMLLGGAYAWTDYSQTVTNRFTGVASNAVLLHDDFDGINKDVYVENLGDSDVFVRVKFAEYLQIGNYSMLEQHGVTTKGLTDDTTTWAVHTWESVDSTVCTEDAKMSHTYYKWTLGNAKTETKYYLEGVTESDANGHGGMSKTEWDDLIAKYKQSICTSDHSTADQTKCADCGATVTTPITAEKTIGNITTTLKETLPASNAMMLEEYNKIADIVFAKAECNALKANDTAHDNCTDETNKCVTCNYHKGLEETVDTARWLLDVDGWAYWSKPLAPHTATNLLLDSVVTTDMERPYDNWAYTIDVQLQAATGNQLTFWYRDGDDNLNNGDITPADADNSKMTTTEEGKGFIDRWVKSLGYTT